LLCASAREKPGQIHTSVWFGKRWMSWAFMSRESCSSTVGATTRTLTSSHDLALYYSVTGAMRCRRCILWLNSVAYKSQWRCTSHQNAFCIASVASALAACSTTVDTCLSVLIVVRLTFWVNVRLQDSSFNSPAGRAGLNEKRWKWHKAGGSWTQPEKQYNQLTCHAEGSSGQTLYRTGKSGTWIEPCHLRGSC
jgi:hypothetical protein